MIPFHSARVDGIFHFSHGHITSPPKTFEMNKLRKLLSRPVLKKVIQNREFSKLFVKIDLATLIVPPFYVKISAAMPNIKDVSL